MKLVKIGRQGHVIKEYAMSDTASFSDLLKYCNESIGPEDQLEINGNVQPIDRCDLNAPLVNNTTIIVVPTPKQMVTNIRIGRVGQVLVPVKITPGVNAISAMIANGFVRDITNEILFLKKSNDPHYDEDISHREYSYRPIEGDILILEKRKIDPKTLYILDLIEYLDSEGCLEILNEAELKETIIKFMITHKI